MRRQHLAVVVAMLCLAAAAPFIVPAPIGPAAAAEPPGSEDDLHARMRQAAVAAKAGNYAEAVQILNDTAQLCRTGRCRALEGDVLAMRGEANQSLGFLNDAIRDFSAALTLLRQSDDPPRIAAVLGAFGNARFRAREYGGALALLEEGLALARRHGLVALGAATANNLGNVLTSCIGAAFTGPARTGAGNRASTQKGETATGAQTRCAGLPPDLSTDRLRDKALALYDDAAVTARSLQDDELLSAVWVNRARLRLRLGEHRAAVADLQAVLKTAEGRAPSLAFGRALLAAGRIAQDLPSTDRDLARDRLTLLYDGLQMALEQGRLLGNQRLLSEAYGYLGAEYERQGRWAEALRLTGQAAKAAEAVDFKEVLFQWEWQRGRLLSATGDDPRALAALRRAVSVLQDIRPDIPIDHQDGTSSFRETMEPLFLRLAELLLRQSERAPGTEAQDLLRETQGTIELLRAAELTDYLRVPCVAERRMQNIEKDTLSADTAVLYPILFPDRVEIVLSIGGQLTRATSKTPLKALAGDVRELQDALQEWDQARAVPGRAKRIYDVVVAPVAAELERRGVHTLVFVPDGILRLVPLAVLHDGTSYLVERYAVATIPGLTLVDSPAVSRGALNVLLAGVGELEDPVLHLQQVAPEMREIQQILPSSSLSEKSFELKSFMRAVRSGEQSVIHISTHGVFNNDPDKSYIEAYDGHLTMNQLEDIIRQRRDRAGAVELLVLSACSSAEGDDRAALGLGGVAVQAGVRSAIGGLWKIKDVAARKLMVEFYKGLKDPSISKAKALQQAQLALLRNSDPVFNSPTMWAPFLLIGHWM